MSDHFPGRVPLGHRDRRAPDRGRQLEQRLVGVGARARARGASSRRATRATTSGATPRTSTCSPSSASARTGSRSSGRASSPRRASGRRARSTTTAGCSTPAATRDLLPVVTFHHFTTPRWARGRRRLDEPRDRRPLRPVLRAGRRRTSATASASACTINEPNVVSLIGLPDGRVPARPRPRPRRRTPRRTSTCVDAHRRGYDAIKAGPGDFPVGLTVVDERLVAAEGGDEDRIDEYRAHARGPVPRGAPAATTSSACRRTPAPASATTGVARARARRRGARRWATSTGRSALEASIRHAAEVAGRPLYVTENGIGTDDDDQRIRYLRDSLDGRRAARLDDGLDVRGYFHWSLHGQLRVGVRLPACASASSRSTARRRRARSSPAPAGSRRS